MAQFNETLARLFPPPQFIALPSVGVDVSDTSLKYVQFERKRGNLALRAWGDLPIADGVVVQGVVKDPKALAAAIKEVRIKTGTENVRLSLPEERAYLFETKVKASLSHTEIADAIEFHLEENVPLSPRDAEFDYSMVNAAPVAGERQVVVTAYARETVASYAEACDRAEVLPLSFEVEAQALARSVVARGDTATCLIVDFGKTRTGIGIVSDGILRLTSTVDTGGKDLDLGLRAAYPDAPAEELIRLKNEYGMLASMEAPKVRESLTPAISNLKNEILTRVTYWNGLPGSKDRQISRVILCGGIANLAGLPGYLSEGMGILVEQAEVWRNAFDITVSVPPITRRYSYGYATAIGLALAGFIDADI